MHVPRSRDFTEDPKEEVWGNQRFWGLGGVLEASYLFYYTPRGKVPSYFGFTSTFSTDLRELFNGLFMAYLRAIWGQF